MQMKTLKSELCDVDTFYQLSDAHLIDPFLKQFATFSSKRLVRTLITAIREQSGDLLEHLKVVEVLRKGRISGFVSDKVNIDIIAVYSQPNEIRVVFDFFLQEKPTLCCNKGRKLDGEATWFFLPGKKSLLDVNYVAVDRDDSEAAVVPQI